MSKKLTTEYVDKYFEQFNWTLLEQYSNINKKLKCLCPEGHLNYKTFNNFKYLNSRCTICSKKELSNKYRNKYDYVKEYIESYNYKLLSKEYINNKTKLKLNCPNNHLYETRFDLFIQGYRCKECHLNKLNINKSNLNLNKKLRINKEKNWIIKNMRNDPNYKNYLNESSNYVLDHIIPINAFKQYIIENNITDISNIRKIINSKNNLQLLTKKENMIKYKSYNKDDLLKYINKYL